MDASLDTNVIIHLYQANLQNILFARFNKLIVYEFIRNTEMANHASAGVIAAFDQDVASGKIELITDGYLKEIGMYNLFLKNVKETRILYNNSDLGEVYAISLAITLGCVCLVTDDIKERGPHYTLMRTPDSDVMPLAFYELLFLDYLDGRLPEADVLSNFDIICDLSKLDMDCYSKLTSFIRRFWTNPYSEKEKRWMSSYCAEKQIDVKTRLRILKNHIQSAGR